MRLSAVLNERSSYGGVASLDLRCLPVSQICRCPQGRLAILARHTALLIAKAIHDTFAPLVKATRAVRQDLCSQRVVHQGADQPKGVTLVRSHEFMAVAPNGAEHCECPGCEVRSEGAARHRIPASRLHGELSYPVQALLLKGVLEGEQHVELALLPMSLPGHIPSQL